MLELEQNGYSRDPINGIWARSEYQGIAYSDGDSTENRLAGIIRESHDLSVLSAELASHCTDWATTYHLSPSRANILRPFEHLLKGRTLEIGAGCGAISRYLGECGGAVLSLEGSPRRAAIAASRTRDLHNVCVVAERFDDFKTDERFDAVTLIGVLEYASMFSADADPAYAMLKRVRELLKPEGHLFIAIENQLGLKYFAGAPEDHLGVPMYGIEGRYTKGQPQTFGRKELNDLLERSGFKTSEFLSPIPDYKLPSSILTEHGFEAENFDAAAFSWQSVKRDMQLPSTTLFSLERAWPVVVSNDLGMELANSFLVVASTGNSTVVPEDLLACHFTTGRVPGYCKEAHFVDGPEGIHVRYRRLGAGHPEVGDSCFRYVLPDEDAYVQGRVLSQEFLELAMTPGWSLDQFGSLLSRYLEALRRLLAQEGAIFALKGLDEQLPGRFIDAIPQNLVIRIDGNPSLVDVEWVKNDGVELGYLLVRALLALIASAKYFSEGQVVLSRRDFVSGAMKAAGLPISSEEIDRYFEIEAAFQQEVTGRKCFWLPDESISLIETSADNLIHASLYCSDAVGAFSEGSVIRFEVSSGRQTLTFPLGGATENSRCLRLDPLDAQGWFSINSLRLLSSGDVMWEWGGTLDELPAVSGLMFVARPSSSALFLSTNNDPHFNLPVDLECFRHLGQIALELDLTRYSDEEVAEDIKGICFKYFDIQGELQKIKDKDCDMAQQILDKDQHINNLTAMINALHDSKSWKVTSPLRQAVFFAKRARRSKQLLLSIIRRGGGLRNTARKALSIWRRLGWAGVMAQVRWHNGVHTLAGISPEAPQPLDRNDYPAWVRLYDTLDDDKRSRMRKDMGTWQRKPLISIVMPVYNPPIDLLQQAVDSVRNQLYAEWELCIADDASSDPQVRRYLQSLEKTDKRIKVVYREENGHISRATNSALDVASGEYIALLDNDDLLPEHALYWVVHALNVQPNAAVIYSDEDKIDVHGNRSAPYFKTDWNPYLFRSHNMISHLGVYRRDLVEHVGRFRIGMEGSQDYDLALRCVEAVRPEQILHIPRVLYHWRMHAGSTAMSPGEKPYAQIAGQKALDEHLARCGIAGHAELLDIGMYRVHYALPEKLPLVSLIIPTRNAKDLVKQCIDSIRDKTTYPCYEIILVDNGSDDPDSLAYFEGLKQLPNVRVLRDDGPFNYSALNNAAVREAHGEIVGLINNDIEVITPQWLEEMVSLALQPGAGAVGARLWYPDDRLQHGGIIMGPLTLACHAHRFLPKGHHGYFGRASLIQGLSAVTAACLLIRKSIFDDVGGLNEVDLRVAFNDVDFCLRVMEAGYQNIWTPNAELYHHESATRGSEDTPEKIERFRGEVSYMQDRWKDVVARDPAYNPNLTLDYEDFSLAWPPRINF